MIKISVRIKMNVIYPLMIASLGLDRARRCNVPGSAIT